MTRLINALLAALLFTASQGSVQALNITLTPFKTPGHLAATPVTVKAAGFAGGSLSTYYPGANAASWYLTGFNYDQNPPGVADLWFDGSPTGSWSQHNWAPPNACHSDQMTWGSDGLRYTATTDVCTSTATQQSYSPGILYLPPSWIAGPWSMSGQSRATYTVNGQVQATGVDSWTSTVIGVEQMSPTETGLHTQTTESTIWQTGPQAGFTTRWDTEFWFVDDLPSPNGPAAGLKRAKGGNLAVASTQYDIWFDRWAAP
jgi:hypothetical protein